MRNKIVVILLIILSTELIESASAQLSYTGFEGLSDESVFTQAGWIGQGFTVPWVNGFDQNRAYIDDAYSQTGTKSLRIFYPQGSYGPPNSGAQAPLMVTPANEYYMSYWVRFSNTFSWGTTSEGGKLPGLGGGGRCSGCAVCTGSNGFTARLMWRTGGKLVLYLYHLDKVSPPCGDNLTLQLSGVDYYITKGQWFQIIERVKVNTGTNHDGEVQLWINEQPALLKTGIQFVSNGDKVDNLYFSTFHGGSTSAWVPTVDSYTWFDDFKISTNPADIFTSLGLDNFNNNISLVSNAANTISISPQPIKSGDFFSINNLGEQSSEYYTLQWSDISGKEILIEEVEVGKEKYKMPEINKGVYILKIMYNNQIVINKIVVD